MAEEKEQKIETLETEKEPVVAGQVEVEEKTELPAEENAGVEATSREIEEKVETAAVKDKKKKKSPPFLRGGRGQAHIKSTYNNTIVSITDLNGALLIWSSAGKCGFKGPKKATPYAAGVIIKSLADKVKGLGVKELDVFVKGVGMGREAAIRAFDTNGIRVVSIKDMTPVPHGGCRPKRPRRV